MNQKHKNFCFCTLALRPKYRLLTQQLASDLEKYSPGTSLLAFTDEPNDFSNNLNVLAFKHNQQGILHCYNDKSLIMEIALSKFNTAIYIDADTRILSPLPDDLNWNPGITVGHCENLIDHVTKYTPERLEHIQKVASNLHIPLESTSYLGESLFIVTRDGGNEIEYFKYWTMIGRYLELNGIHSGEGNAMGLAAKKVGWTISKDGWQEIRSATQHLDASHINKQQTSWDKWKRRLGYHYRLNKARLIALQDFDFYYR